MYQALIMNFDSHNGFHEMVYICIQKKREFYSIIECSMCNSICV